MTSLTICYNNCQEIYFVVLFIFSMRCVKINNWKFYNAMHNINKMFSTTLFTHELCYYIKTFGNKIVPRYSKCFKQQIYYNQSDYNLIIKQ